MFIGFAGHQLKTIASAKVSLGPAEMKRISKSIRDKKGKTSSIENKAKSEAFDKAMNKKLKPVKYKTRVDVTVLMDGSVILSLLNKKNDGREYLTAELDHQNIKTWMKLSAARKDEMDKIELRHLLRSQECTRLFDEEKKVYDNETKVSEIKPLSDKMQEWLPIQWRIVNEKQGILEDDDAIA